MCTLCAHSMIFLKEKLRWSDWRLSCAVSIASPGSCTARLSQTHWKGTAEHSDPQTHSSAFMGPAPGLGGAHSTFRNKSSAPRDFSLSRCLLIYCSNKAMVRVALQQTAANPSRKAELGPPSISLCSFCSKGSCTAGPKGPTQSRGKLLLPLTATWEAPAAGTHLLKHHHGPAKKMVTTTT